MTLGLQQAWPQKAERNLPSFCLILKTFSCVWGTEIQRQIAYHSVGTWNQAQLYNNIIGGRECIYRFR